MKKITVFILLVTCITNAQFAEPYMIDNSEPFRIKVNKINSDNLIDILALYVNENKVSWYENTNENGEFGNETIITQSLVHPAYIDLADLNGDGSMDVLVSAREDSKVVWYINDGNGNFSPENVITATNFGQDADKVQAADIDGDGDMDVVFALGDQSKLVWFENLNGQGVFSSEKIISNTAIGVYEFDIGDLDGDGDLDIVCNSSTTGFPSWFKNIDGMGNFGSEIPIDNIGTFNIVISDIDGDGDNDLLKRELINSTVTLSWLDNVDGMGIFFQRQLISSLSDPSGMFLIDIDNDYDNDILVSYVGEGKVGWFENIDGQGTFGDLQIIEDNLFSARAIYGAKIDNDEFNDVVVSTSKSLGGGAYEYNLVWYKNLTYLNTQENLLLQLSLTPNPTTGILYLQAPNSTIESITVYDVLGKPVLQQNNNLTTIDLSGLQNGMYLVKVTGNNGGTVVKKVVLSR